MPCYKVYNEYDKNKLFGNEDAGSLIIREKWFDKVDEG